VDVVGGRRRTMDTDAVDDEVTYEVVDWQPAGS
jgi:hypothetical protein